MVPVFSRNIPKIDPATIRGPIPIRIFVNPSNIRLIDLVISKPKPIPVQRPEHDEFDQEDVIAGRKTMDITVDQDVHLIRDVQNGMRSRGFKKQVLNDDEARIQHYHDWYAWFMES